MASRKLVEHLVEGFDGTEIYYTVRGEGPALVFCDGIACDGYAWKSIRPGFWDRALTLHWHYRGHGRSGTPVDLDRLSIADLVRDLACVLDQAEIDRAILLGHSMGVQVILEAVHRLPDRVRALIPICGSFQHPLDTFHNSTLLKDVFPLMYQAMIRYPRPLEALVRTVVPRRLTFELARLLELNPVLTRFEDFFPYLQHLATMEASVFARMLQSASEHSAEPYLGQIRVPTLIIAAQKDSFTPFWVSEIMRDRIRNAELCVIRNGSHSAVTEQPDLITLRIEKFLYDRELW